MSFVGKNISVSVQVSLPNGGVVGEITNLNVEVIDESQVVIPSGSADSEIVINPCTQISYVSLLIIKSDSYPSGVSYKIASSGNPSISLRNAHFFVGSGSILTTNKIPNIVFITNNSNQAVTLTIITARNAFPV
jgi:hypothetical protein